MPGTQPPHGGDLVAAALAAHGVKQVFTLCGGHIAPILTAARARGIRVLDVRDEAAAVFAADASARLSGRAAVAAVTAGPGVTNVITALKNAQLAQSPVVVLGGAAPTALQGRGALQDIDQRALVAPHVKRFLRVRRVRELAPAVAAALRIAGSGVPGPVFVECAVDLLYPEATVRGWYAQGAPKGGSLAARVQRAYLHWHLNRLFAPGGGFAVQPVAVPPPPDSAVRSAAAALARAERPLAVIGSQALADANAAAALADAVTQLGVPVYLSGMARGLLGRTHPLLLRHRRREALREADCVLLAGVPCDFRLDYGGQIRRTATVIAANRSRRDATLNRRPQVLALGDAGRFLQALAQRVRPAA
ncbi:MAG: thiamine pyrophosphate-binding protein, partial [Burkholderiaceae bacterium]|nr:thiamine pyrophosphate-binding protein [Burkholderiaceae bacterium]